MAVRGIHHLGVAVADLDAAVELYARLFGAELEHRADDRRPGRRGRLAARRRRGRVELLAPLAPETPVGRFLDGRGPGMHHVAFEVDDIDAELARLAGEGRRADRRAAARRVPSGSRSPSSTRTSLDGVLAELVAHG